MPHPIAARLAAAAFIAACGTTAVHAQLMDAVKGALGGGSASGGNASGSMFGGLGGLGGLGDAGGALPSLDSIGTGNLTGVLAYCARNNYLGGDAASVKDKLLGKLGGEQRARSDAGYQQGLSGILGGSSGKKVELGGGGLQAQITEKVCDQVLEYGKSLL